MGTLKPGAKYIYERNDNVVYAREFGATERTPIGWDYDPVSGHTTDESHRFDPRTPDGKPLHEHLKEADLWGKIRREAKTNITLQKALDRAIMIYKLSKDKV
jgi:hypothetical protein